MHISVLYKAIITHDISGEIYVFREKMIIEKKTALTPLIE